MTQRGWSKCVVAQVTSFARPRAGEAEGVVARGRCSAALAARHGAGSRKAAQNRTMSLYGNNRMQRHFLLSARAECGARAPPSG